MKIREVLDKKVGNTEYTRYITTLPKDVVKNSKLLGKELKALWSASILMTAIVIQHDFIENHSTTDEVPSERAGVNLELGDNRWLDLIKRSSTFNSKNS